MGTGYGFFKRVEVNDDQIKFGDLILLHFFEILWNIPAAQNGTKYFWMKCFNSSSEDAGVGSNRFYGDTGYAERLNELLCSASGIYTDPICMEFFYDGFKTIFIENRYQSRFDLFLHTVEMKG
jgi:hypothetical protein